MLDQLLHIRLKHLAPAAADFDGVRPVGIAKIVNVTPIFRRRCAGILGKAQARHLFKKGLDDASLTGPCKTGNEDIKPWLVYAEAEFNRAYRAVLTDEILERRHVRRACKR